MRTTAPTRLERDRAMILDPDNWPLWPTLPLKRRDGDAQHADGFTGFLMNVDHSQGPVKVYTGNMHRTDDVAKAVRKERGLPDTAGLTWGDILSKMDSKTFASLDELLAVYTVD